MPQVDVLGVPVDECLARVEYCHDILPVFYYNDELVSEIGDTLALNLFEPRCPLQGSGLHRIDRAQVIDSSHLK